MIDKGRLQAEDEEEWSKFLQKVDESNHNNHKDEIFQAVICLLIDGEVNVIIRQRMWEEMRERLSLEDNCFAYIWSEKLLPYVQKKTTLVDGARERAEEIFYTYGNHKKGYHPKPLSVLYQYCRYGVGDDFRKDNIQCQT